MVSFLSPLGAGFSPQYDGWDVIADHVLDVNQGAINETLYRYLWAAHDRPGMTSPLSGGESGYTTSLLLNQEVVYGAAWDEFSYWTLADMQNSVRDVVEFLGGGIQRSEHVVYDSFGRVARAWNVYNPGTNNNDLTITRYAYAGQEYDNDTGYHLNNRRWLDNATGTWLTHDPIEWKGGLWNLANYVGNDPVNKTDPSGLVILQIGIAGDFTPLLVHFGLDFSLFIEIRPGVFDWNIGATFGGGPAVGFYVGGGIQLGVSNAVGIMSMDGWGNTAGFNFPDIGLNCSWAALPRGVGFASGCVTAGKGGIFDFHAHRSYTIMAFRTPALAWWQKLNPWNWFFPPAPLPLAAPSPFLWNNWVPFKVPIPGVVF